MGVAVTSAIAATPPWPNTGDIDRAMKATPFPSPKQLESQAIPLPPRVDPKPAGIDVEALVRGRFDQANPLGVPAMHATSLRIFITLDMPASSLALLADQAARSGAVLVLRGLKHQSMRETIMSVQALIGDRNVAVVIDPEAFTRFGVHVAPTFVVTLDAQGAGTHAGCTANCVVPASFVAVAGDVSLDYALEHIARQRPHAASRVGPMLRRLRGS